MLKGQDIVVLAAIMDGRRQGESYAQLGAHTCLSASETHAAVKRLQDASLIGPDRHVLKRNVLEFLIHGIRYAFPFRSTGVMAKGMPTSYAAPVADGAFAVAGTCPVWRSQSGHMYGQAFEPLYATAPNAAVKDRGLYDCLALIDMLRGGRLRERRFAESKITEMIP